tara:strand:- start:34 stop:219 length:186 start_codon:yes stop_codon:yes gene_type:complete
MSFLLHSKKARLEVEKIIKEHVERCRRNYSWSGEHEEVTKEILDFLRWGKLKKVKKNEKNT